MKSTSLVFGFVLIGIGIGVALAYVEVGGNTVSATVSQNNADSTVSKDKPLPIVEVDNAEYDFGSMERGTLMEHNFIFKNAGKGPLTLKVGESTCKCTVGDLPAGGEVAPGASVPVRLEWRAKTNSSKFSQSATIHTNDPLHQRVNLSISGLVNEPASLSPRMFEYGKVLAGDTSTSEIFLMSYQQKKFKILEHSFIGVSREEDYEVSFEPVETDELPDSKAVAGYRIKLTAKGSVPFGPFSGWIRLETNLKRVQSIDVEFRGRVFSDVTVFGPEYSERNAVLRLGHWNSSEGASGKLLIRSHDKQLKDLNLKITETFPKYLKATVVPIGKSKTNFQVKVQIEPGAPAAVFVGGDNGEYGRVVLETSHPKVPKIEINVRFIIEK